MNPKRYQMIRKTSLISAFANAGLAALKILVGFFGYSHALVADGFHSLSDLVTDGLVLLAAKAGAAGPDLEHPYGHQRIETFAAIVIATLLIFVGGAIGYHTLLEINHHVLKPLPQFPVLLVAIFSVIVNELVFRYMFRIGSKLDSNLLKSNAWHNRSDALVSGLVLLSMIGVYLGFRWLDAVAAIVIALLIIKIAIQISYKAVKELIDTGVDAQTLEAIKQIIKDTPGVIAVHQLRSRLYAGNIFIDVHIIVDSFISVSEGHHIGDHVHARLLKNFSRLVDVVVHIDPEDDEHARSCTELPNRLEVINKINQSWNHLPYFAEIQKTLLHYLNGELTIEVFFSDSIAGNLKTIQKDYQDSGALIHSKARVILHQTTS